MKYNEPKNEELEYPEGWDDNKVEYEMSEQTSVQGIMLSGINGLMGVAFAGLGAYGLVDGNQEALEVSMNGLEYTTSPEMGDAIRNGAKLAGGLSWTGVMSALGKKEINELEEYQEAKRVYRNKND